VSRPSLSQRFPRFLALAALCVPLGLGCQGVVGEAVDGPDGPAAGSGQPGGPGNDPGAPGGLYCEEAPTPLRRLSHEEYRETLRRLYPDVDIGDLGLPEDQISHEFDNDADALVVDGILAERYVDLGLELAPALVAAVASCPDPGDLVACGEALVRREGRRLFRRPLSDEEVAAYAGFFRDGAGSIEDRATLTFATMLSAPEFLYRFERPVAPLAAGEGADLDAYSLASRLAFFLWGSGPDDTLLDAAAAGRLDTDEGLRAEAERMLEDDRARETFVRFHRQWLDLDRIFDTPKADEDGLDGRLRRAMVEETERFVERVLFEEDGTLADLFSSPRVFLNDDIAELYGVPAPTDGWQETSIPERAGVLTRTAFLASHGHPDRPSPVLRGVFVLERILCQGTGAPPPDAEAMGLAAAEDIDPATATNRELYDAMTRDPGCRTCHDAINPAGFVFEQFDTMGRFRTEEANGRAIDASAELLTLGPIDGAADLGAALAASEDARRCAVEKWARYAYGGGPMERAACFLDDLEAALADSGGRIRDLQLALVMHPSFRRMRLPAEEQETP